MDPSRPLSSEKVHMKSNPVNPAFSTVVDVPGPDQLKWKTVPSTWTSYRVGVAGCALACFAVFTINVVGTAVALKQHGVDDTGIGTLLDGSCGETKKVNTWLHLGINSLSTVLLASTNYCMQCVNAPTRSQVD